MPFTNLAVMLSISCILLFIMYLFTSKVNDDDDDDDNENLNLTDSRGRHSCLSLYLASNWHQSQFKVVCVNVIMLEASA